MNEYIGCIHFYVFHDFFVIQRRYLYFIYNTNRYFQNKKQDFFKNKTADLGYVQTPDRTGSGSITGSDRIGPYFDYYFDFVFYFFFLVVIFNTVLVF